MNVTNHLGIIRNALIQSVIEGPELIPGPSNDCCIVDLHLPYIHDRLPVFPDQRGLNVKRCHCINIQNLLPEIAFSSGQDRNPPDVSEIIFSTIADHLPFFAFRASLAALALFPLDGFLASLEISLTFDGSTVSALF